MLRTVAIVTLAATLLLQGLAARGGSPGPESPPVTYELQINGESFLVEANRDTTLESKRKPGVRYNVALRVSPTQRMRLNSLLFDYDLPARIEDGIRRAPRSVRIAHELGFSVLLTDLGRPLSQKEQQEALKVLVDSVTATLHDMKAEGVNVADPHERMFNGSSARGTAIRYRDAKGFGHVYLLYVLTGPKHGATCVAEYLENDSEDVLPLIKKTLDSIRPIPERR